MATRIELVAAFAAIISCWLLYIVSHLMDPPQFTMVLIGSPLFLLVGASLLLGYFGLESPPRIDLGDAGPWDIVIAMAMIWLLVRIGEIITPCIIGTNATRPREN